MDKENLIFLPDSPYAQWIIERCESNFPNKNRFICICADTPKYPNPSLTCIGVLREELVDLASSLRDYQRIIINYHTDILGFLLEYGKVEPEKVTWVLWSGDLYNSPFFDRPIYRPLTSQLIGYAGINKPKGLSLGKELAKYYLKRPGFISYEKSFQRIGAIASCFEQDVAQASRVFKKSFRMIPMGLLSFEELLRGLPVNDSFRPGQKILLGHAGVPENNHLDLFQKIKSLKTERSLICPLSYGIPVYIEKIDSQGRLLFGDQIEFLTQFLPRDEYYQKLAEVGFAIFDTLVQQAFGNILGLLYLGVKVFLNEENSIYHQLKKMGLMVYSMNELNEEAIKFPLTDDQISHNRKIVEVNFSEERINHCYKLLLTA